MNDRENVSQQLPKTPEEAALLRKAISALLLRIPDTWTEYDFDDLTGIEQRARFLMIAGGFIENRSTVQMKFHPLNRTFDVEFSGSGETGMQEALKPIFQDLWLSHTEAIQTWMQNHKGFPPMNCHPLGRQRWRVATEGIQVRKDLTDGKIGLVYDWVLKRGFFEKRGTVGGAGRLIQKRVVDEPKTGSASVSVDNWKEGAAAIAESLAATLQAAFPSKSAKGKGPASKPQKTDEERDAFEAKFWSVYTKAGLTEACREMGLNAEKGNRLRNKLRARRYRTLRKAEKERRATK